MVWYPGKNIYDKGTIFRFRGWPLTGFGIPMDTHGQTWQQVWRFTINDSWWQKRSNLPFFWFCWEVFITKNGDSNGLSVYYVSVYFGIMGLSEQKMDSWIPPFLARKSPARSWNIYWMEFGMGFHMWPLYKWVWHGRAQTLVANGANLAMPLNVARMNPEVVAFFPWAIQRLTYGLPDVDWQSATVHQ